MAPATARDADRFRSLARCRHPVAAAAICRCIENGRGCGWWAIAVAHERTLSLSLPLTLSPPLNVTAAIGIGIGIGVGIGIGTEANDGRSSMEILRLPPRLPACRSLRMTVQRRRPNHPSS